LFTITASLVPSCENSSAEISIALVSPLFRGVSPAPVEVVSHILKKKSNIRGFKDEHLYLNVSQLSEEARHEPRAMDKRE